MSLDLKGHSPTNTTTLNKYTVRSSHTGDLVHNRRSNTNI
jgi:hypothetical protein